jgi:hypothetical protein
MSKVNKKIKNTFLIFSLIMVFFLPQTGYSYAEEETPSGIAMTADLLIARPLLLGVTVVGSALYVLALPITLSTGTAGETGKTLVVGPAKATFWRCLGCKKSGYKTRER